MKLVTRETLLSSGFVLIGSFDLATRVFFLDRASYTCNLGAFWGLSLPSALILVVGAALLGTLAWILFREEHGFSRGALLAMLVGGTVNWLDRLFHGCVLDYFVWPLGLSATFPNFNLGDMLLLLGLLGLGWDYWKRSCTAYASQGIFGSDTGTRRGSRRD